MAKARPESELPRTLDEFDRWHALQPERWEFIDGQAVMMAPARNPHTLIKTNIGAALWGKLRGKPCRVLIDGPEVKGVDLSAIPDVVVTCAPVDPATGRVDEPTLIVEVMSPSTEDRDVGRKWNGYCLIPSLRHYLLVASKSRFATLHTRIADFEWSEMMFQEGEITLQALDARLTLDEIYEGVDFTPAADA